MKLIVNKELVSIEVGDKIEAINFGELNVVQSTSDTVAVIDPKSGDYEVLTREEVEMIILRVIKQSGIIKRLIGYVVSLFKKRK